MKKIKWWMVLIAVLTVVSFVSFGFRDAILVRLMPELILSDAIANTAAALQNRTADTPLVLLQSLSDAEGKYSADLKLETANDLLGSVNYDMKIRVDSDPRQIHASGMVTTAGKQVDLSFMINSSCALVSSDALLQGNYYGIDFASFSQNIRSNPLLMFVLPEATVSDWEDGIASLQMTMNRESIKLPDFSREDIRTIVTGVLLLDGKVSSESFVFDGKPINCWKISYSATGDQIRNGLNRLESADQLQKLAELKSVSVNFWVYEGAVYKFGLIADSDQMLDLEVIFYKDASRHPISVKWSGVKNEKPVEVSMEIETTHENGRYKETWDVSETNGDIEELFSLSYDWNPANGEIHVNKCEDGIENTFSLLISEREEGIYMETDDLDSLLMALEVCDRPFSADVSCKMTVTKGAPLEALPSYKGMGEWSVSDFLLLLESVGALLGLKIG
ncbi:MAG: hypothetical protein IIV18_08290 [Lachnospiraceae bacterium]|nr:hypothetical protein [Lachnospiraceae bacterium]